MTAEPRGRLRPARRRTLQLRLTAGVVALLTLAAVTIGLATVLGLHRYLVDQLDGQIDAAVDRVLHAYDDSRTDGDDGPGDGLWAPREVAGLTAGTLVVQLADIGSQAYVIAEGATQLDDQDLAALAAVPSERDHRTVSLSSGEYRVSAAPDGADGGSILVGMSLRDLDRTMARVLTMEGVVFAAVISLAGVAAAVLVGRSLEPLRRVAGTATRVADLPLGSGDVTLPERVPTADPASEVGQVSAALNMLLDHVEESFGERAATEQRLRRFVADASHELRTPVSVISGYTQLAQREGTELPSLVVKSLDRIAAETSRMATLVDDLLLLARLDSGRPLACESVDLSRLAIDVVDDARAAGPDHRWRLDLPEEPLIIVGDEHRLHQVLANLAANARTHTPVGTTVSVLVRPADDAGWIQVEVVDDGPGIPDSVQPVLFERFARGEASRSRATGGAGLGLAIVSAVVSAHGGTVSAGRGPEGGARFTIRLPSGGPPERVADGPGQRARSG
jgi:two-component system, OmpR family, sensor kinase